MAHLLTTIGLHLECEIQAEMVVELHLALIERKQSRRFRHKSIICKKAMKVRKCAKVKGHAQLKIEKPRVKTIIGPYAEENARGALKIY